MPTATAVNPPKELRTQITAIQQQKFPKAIQNQKQFDLVADTLKTIKQFRSAWDAYWRPEIDAAHKLHRSLMAKFKEGDNPAAAAETTAKFLIGDFTRRKEAQEAEERRKKAEELAARQRAEREAKAAEAAAMGAPEAIVEAIKEAPLAIPEPDVKPKFERAEGILVGGRWDATCDDLRTFVGYLAGIKMNEQTGERELTYPHWEDLNMILPDDTAGRKRAESQKELFSLPGWRAFKKTVVRSSNY
jgi:hypothetical protein